jgi:hypothetical protein
MRGQQASNLDLPEAIVSLRNTVTRLFNDVIAGRDLSDADWCELIDDFCNARQSWQRRNMLGDEGEIARHAPC